MLLKCIDPRGKLVSWSSVRVTVFAHRPLPASVGKEDVFPGKPSLKSVGRASLNREREIVVDESPPPIICALDRGMLDAESFGNDLGTIANMILEFL